MLRGPPLPRRRRLVRWALRTKWAPVGSGVMPRSETAFLLRHLVDGDVVGRLDGNVHKLPGLDGLDIVRRAARSYGIAA